MIYSTTLSQTALLCMMGMIHSVSPNAKENSSMQSEMKMGRHEVEERHISPGWIISMQNYRGRKETLRYLVDYSSLFLSEVSWMAALQVLKQEQSCSVDILKKYIPVTWTYSPTGFC